MATPDVQQGSKEANRDTPQKPPPPLGCDPKAAADPNAIIIVYKTNGRCGNPSVLVPFILLCHTFRYDIASSLYEIVVSLRQSPCDVVCFYRTNMIEHICETDLWNVYETDSYLAAPPVNYGENVRGVYHVDIAAAIC